MISLEFPFHVDRNFIQFLFLAIESLEMPSTSHHFRYTRTHTHPETLTRIECDALCSALADLLTVVCGGGSGQCARDADAHTQSKCEMFRYFVCSTNGNPLRTMCELFKQFGQFRLCRRMPPANKRARASRTFATCAEGERREGRTDASVFSESQVVFSFFFHASHLDSSTREKAQSA